MSSPATLWNKPEASADSPDEADGPCIAPCGTNAPSFGEPPGCPTRAATEIGLRPEPSDEALMQGIAARVPLALDQLHARYRTLLSKLVAPILPNHADAEETIQDVFTEIWTHAGRFDGRRGKPLGWMVCMTRRRAIDHWRKLRSRVEAGERLRPAEEPASGAAAPGCTPVSACVDEVEASDLTRLLREAIGGLPAEQGRVVYLTYFRAMSQREIARHTGLPHGTIKTRLELAKSKLLQRLGPLRAELSYTR